MPSITQQMRRETGAAGKPGAAGQPGQMAINFPGNQLWSFSATASDWVLLNPPGASPNVRGVTATATGGAIEADFNTDAITVAAGDIVVYTHNGNAFIYTGAVGAPVTAAHAGDFTALGAAVAYALAAAVKAGVSTAEAINPANLRAELQRLFGMTGTAFANAVATAASAGAGDAGKLVKLDAAGKLDSGLLPGGTVNLTGGVDITAAPATGAKAGDLLVVGTGGTANAGYTGLTGNVPVGSVILFNGTKYEALATAATLANYLLLAGGTMAVGAAIIMDGGTAGKVILDGTNPANSVIQNVTLDGGTY